MELAWWSSARLEELRLRLVPIWARWLGDWMAAPPGGANSVAVGLAHERAASELKSWSVLGTRDRAFAWIAGADASCEFRQLLFASDHRESSAAACPIANAVAQRAQDALTTVLLRELKLDDSSSMQSPATSLFAPWSGAIVIQLMSAGGSSLELMLNREAASLLLPSDLKPAIGGAARPALCPVGLALADRKLSLRIELGACEFDFGTLTTLREGDVIPLPHALSEPLHVISEDGEQLCAAHLGAQGASKAIELLSSYGTSDKPITTSSQLTK
jgi:hypothetical protein